ncbi:hypothetical protein QKW52_28505 [Bacillus sonorensis]|nr:hypothetical protein [Bacillus sonorensis]
MDFIAVIFENIASKGIRLQYVQFSYDDLTYETKNRLAVFVHDVISVLISGG